MIAYNRGLTNNFLGIILAVIGIVGLAFLGVKIYNSFVGLEEQNAQSFINDLKGKMDILRDGENNTFFMRGIDNWFLVAFNRDEKTSTGQDILRPDKCFLDDHCLCICEGSPSATNCQEQGFCRKMDREIKVTSILTEDVIRSAETDVRTGAKSGKDRLYRGSFKAFCLPFMGKSLIPLNLNKGVSSYSVTYDYGLFNDANTFSQTANNPRYNLFTKLVGLDTSGVLFQCVYEDGRVESEI